MVDELSSGNNNFLEASEKVTIHDIAKSYEVTIDSLNIVKESSIDDVTGNRNSFANVVSSQPDKPKLNFRKRGSCKVAFPVVENYVYNAWGKFGIQKIMMNAKGFYFFKFSSKKGMDDVLENGPWMIRQVPIILNKWTPSASLTKANHSIVPVWVKMHDVPMATFTDDGLSIIASKIGNPIMLDSYTSTMCNEFWGRSSFARAIIEIQAEAKLKESVVVAVPNLDGEGYMCETVKVEYEWKPPRCSTCKIFGHMVDHCPMVVKEMPVKQVERDSDSFEQVKKRNSEKKKSDKTFVVNAKKNMKYVPVAKSNGTRPSKTKVASSSKQNGKQVVGTSNPFSVLQDEENEDWNRVGSSRYVELEPTKEGTVELESDD
ncbi:zinc knuckle CX2CX4HX4C containing protein [Tanacetum coccineum]|uniref:Zinc knuckle CX2CX4HX4C containing protein n=1 Tax=Tanacetum coccineum TaxID=301880 RepID=A0ABQ4XHF4_9ASTR